MSQPILPRTATIGILLLAAFLQAHGADDCTEWKRTYATYEDEVYKAIQDEPEDLPKELRRHAKANANGYTDQAKKIESKIRGGLTGLLAIDPHPDMTRFHADLIDCYRNGVAVLDAEARGDGPGRNAAEIRTWQAFRRMFVTVRDLLVSDYLRHIDGEIEALKSGIARPPGG